jgi:hypothetical protein
MHPTAAEIEPKRGPKVRLIGLRHLDNRTRASRRARKLAAALEAEIGGDLSEGDKLAVERAAVLATIAQDAEARRLRGESVPLDDIVRTSRLARLALADVRKLRKRPARQPSALDALLPEHGSDDAE